MKVNLPGIPAPEESRHGPGNVLLPLPLVRGEQLELDGVLWEALCLAERALGALDGYARALPDGESFAELMLLRESAHSNRIEGGRASVADLLWWRTDQGHEAADAGLRGELRLASNCIDALEMGIAAVADKGEALSSGHPGFSTRLIRALHARLFHHVRGRDSHPGELRDSEIWIGPPGSTFETAWFVPPAPALVADSMAALQRFVRSGDAAIAPLLKVAIVYYQLETIYPFVDGNGRVARLVIPLLLSRQPGVRARMLSLSSVFARDRAEHFRQLQHVRTQGEWAGWFGYFLQAVQVAAEESLALMAQTERQRRRDEAAISQAFGDASARPARQLLAALVSRPLLSVSTAAEITGRAFANANQLVRKLEGLGILREVTGRKRHRRYCYVPLVELLAGPPAAG